MTSHDGNEETCETTNMSWKPKVFIGSSSTGKAVAQTVRELLEEGGQIEVEVWHKKFKVGETYIDVLLRALEEFDFAVLVITADDERIREEIQVLTMRDNVLFELGLFMGRLGRHRAIMLYDEKQKATLPSDLGGIHVATFSGTENSDLKAALQASCDEIREYILNPYEPPVYTYETWKKSCYQIYEALKKAPEEATIRIIQTWLPDIEDFIEDLEILLTEYKKRFKFQILLISYDQTEDENHFDLLGARIKYRKDSRKNAIRKIEDSISQFIDLKNKVEAAWKKSGDKDPKLDLKIGKYDFLPFGPYYQIGNEVLFVGFYLNHCSSINAPMLKIRSTERLVWHRFERHFEIGWENAKIVYSPEGKDGKNEIGCG